MIQSIIEFKRELAAVAEREWVRLRPAERSEILADYDVRSRTETLDWAIFGEQWRRERGG